MNITEKIRKLLLLAKDSGASEHEASLALSKAYELLAKYELELSEILQTDDHVIIQKILCKKQRLHVTDKFIFDILQTWYHVTLLRGQDYNTQVYILVGTPVHCEIAGNIYTYLHESFLQSYRTYKHEKKYRRVQAQAFYLGMYTGLYSKLQVYHDHQSSQALVIYDRKIQEYIHQLYGDIRTLQKETSWAGIRDTTAYRSGEQSGRSIPLHHVLLSYE